MIPPIRVAALAAIVVAPVAALAACGDSTSSTAAAQAPRRPAATTAAATCTRSAALTEGPYWKAGSPTRRTIRTAGTSGTPLRLTGRVVDTACRPIARATIDVWQADGKGVYDNAGYRLRGRQKTRADGTWTLNTVVPGLYPGRTEHVHVKIRTASGSALTSQLFFPGSSANDEDGIYVPSMRREELPQGRLRLPRDVHVRRPALTRTFGCRASRPAARRPMREVMRRLPLTPRPARDPRAARRRRPRRRVHAAARAGRLGRRLRRPVRLRGGRSRTPSTRATRTGADAGHRAARRPARRAAADPVRPVRARPADRRRAPACLRRSSRPAPSPAAWRGCAPTARPRSRAARRCACAPSSPPPTGSSASATSGAAATRRLMDTRLRLLGHRELRADPRG